MPRYFFHVTYEGEHPDREGVELPDDQAAYRQAVAACTGILKDIDGAMRSETTWSMKVVEENRGTLCNLMFRAELVGVDEGDRAPDSGHFDTKNSLPSP